MRGSAGDRTGLGDAFRRHAPAVYRYLLGLTGDRSEAEDLLQDTFLAALMGLPRFRERSTLKTWLMAIARRRYLMHQRTRRRRPRTVEGSEVLTRIPDAGPGGGNPLDLLTSLDEVRRLLDGLPERQRSIFWLREYADLTPAETAAVLGCSVASVKVGLFRARRRLAAALGREAPGAG